MPLLATSRRRALVISFIAIVLCVAALWLRRPMVIEWHRGSISHYWNTAFHPDRLWSSRLRALVGLPAASQRTGQLQQSLAAILHHRQQLEGLGYFRRTVVEIPAVEVRSNKGERLTSLTERLNSTFPHFELLLDNPVGPTNFIGVTIVAPEEQLDALRARFIELSVQQEPP